MISSLNSWQICWILLSQKITAVKIHFHNGRIQRKVSSTNKTLISYDISSLLTSIPLNEIIELAVNLIFENNSNITKKKLQRKILKTFWIRNLRNTHLFDKNYYDQIDGVATVHPLGLCLLIFLWVFTKSNC